MNKKYYVLVLYALYSIYNLQIAHCDSLTDVLAEDTTKTNKTLGWLCVIGATLFCSYLIYKGMYPTDSTEIVSSPTTSSQTTHDVNVQALNDKILSKTSEQNNTNLKDNDYLKLLQELTRYDKK